MKIPKGKHKEIILYRLSIYSGIDEFLCNIQDFYKEKGFITDKQLYYVGQKFKKIDRPIIYRANFK